MSDVMTRPADVPVETMLRQAAKQPLQSRSILAPTNEGCREPIATTGRLEELAVEVSNKLNDRANRRAKADVSETIRTWLLKHHRLLKDISDPDNPQPYLLTDSGEAVPISPKARDIRLALAFAGINASEPAYAWICHDLETAALTEGEKVLLSRWSTVRQGVVYISAGKSHMIVARHGHALREEPNGYDGILFASESTFPSWKVAAPVPLRDLHGMALNLEAPAEAPGYTPQVQWILYEAWHVAQFLNTRPLPACVPIGGRGSGKSTTARTTEKVLLGSSGDLSPVPSKHDSFIAAVTNLPLYGIDNLDSVPEKWFQDAIATCVTGGKLQDRLYYTNADLHERAITAAIIVTTRTATFANRSDISERLLPLFFGQRLDKDRIDETLIYDDAVARRDGVLSWLALEAAKVASDTTEARGLPSRFQGFAKVAMRNDAAMGREAVMAWTQAQGLAVAENDPLLDAILSHYNSGLAPLVEVRAAELVKQLTSPIPNQGGGKAIARKLREMTPTLRMAGLEVIEGERGGHNVFTIQRAQ